MHTQGQVPAGQVPEAEQDSDPLSAVATPWERFIQPTGDDETTSIKEAKNFKSPESWGDMREASLTSRSQELLNAADAGHITPGQVPATEFGQDLNFGQVPPIDQRSSKKQMQQQVQRWWIEAFATEIESNRQHDIPYEIFTMPNVKSQEEMEHPLFASKAKSDPDTMYLHEALRQPDWKEFVKAMDKELQYQLDHGNFTIVHKSTFPEGATVLPTVWVMHQKWKQDTGEIYKYKGWLNVYGSKQEKGVNYWETFTPVATWATKWFILVLNLIHNWKTWQINYVQAYTQVNVPLDDLYVKVPKGVEVENGRREDYVMKVNKNVYGTHQAGWVWNKHLVTKLELIGFTQAKWASVSSIVGKASTYCTPMILFWLDQMMMS